MLTAFFSSKIRITPGPPAPTCPPITTAKNTITTTSVDSSKNHTKTESIRSKIPVSPPGKGQKSPVKSPSKISEDARKTHKSGIGKKAGTTATLKGGNPKGGSQFMENFLLKRPSAAMGQTSASVTRTPVSVALKKHAPGGVVAPVVSTS